MPFSDIQGFVRSRRQLGDERLRLGIALAELAVEASLPQRRDDGFVRAALVCLLLRSDSLLQLLHRAAPLSLAPFPFRRVSSELMLSSTASKFGGLPKIMPCMAL